MRNEQLILDQFRRIVQTLHLASRKAETRIGTSGAQLFVLTILSREPGLSVNELAERTFTHQSSVSVVVSRLVEQGLARRQVAAEDARRLKIQITEKGRKLLKGAHHMPQEKLFAAISALEERERRQLAELLSKIIETAGFTGKAPPMFFEDSSGKSTRGSARKKGSKPR